MRDSFLTSLFLASATLASANRLECFHTRSRELAVAASCGDEGSLNYCLSTFDAPTAGIPSDLERCFVWAGCTAEEAKIEAVRVLEQCDNPNSDLRRNRRQVAPENSNNNVANAFPVPTAGAAAAAAAVKEAAILAARDPMPLITAMNIPRQAATTSGRPASPTECFSSETTDTTTCPIQTTGPESGKRLPCFPTYIVNAKCIEGLICKSDNQGNPSCMYKHRGLDLGGIIIACVFAGAIAIAIVTICFMCCRERREHKRIERAAEAARIAKEAKTQATVAAKRPGVSVTGGVSPPAVEGQPLMYQTGGGGGGAGPVAGSSSPGGHQQQGYGGANPFVDAPHDGHPMR